MLSRTLFILKKYEAWIVIAIVALLVISASFLLGYALGKQNSRTPIIIEKHIEAENKEGS